MSFGRYNVATPFTPQQRNIWMDSIGAAGPEFRVPRTGFAPAGSLNIQTGTAVPLLVAGRRQPLPTWAWALIGVAIVVAVGGLIVAGLALGKVGLLAPKPTPTPAPPGPTYLAGGLGSSAAPNTIAGALAGSAAAGLAAAAVPANLHAALPPPTLPAHAYAYGPPTSAPHSAMHPDNTSNPRAAEIAGATLAQATPPPPSPTALPFLDSALQATARQLAARTGTSLDAATAEVRRRTAAAVDSTPFTHVMPVSDRRKMIAAAAEDADDGMQRAASALLSGQLDASLAGAGLMYGGAATGTAGGGAGAAGGSGPMRPSRFTDPSDAQNEVSSSAYVEPRVGADEVRAYMAGPTNTWVLIAMDGCGPCAATRDMLKALHTGGAMGNVPPAVVITRQDWMNGRLDAVLPANEGFPQWYLVGKGRAIKGLTGRPATAADLAAELASGLHK